MIALRRVVVAGLVLLYGVPVYFLVTTSLKTTDAVFENPAGLVFTPTLSAYAEVFAQGIGRSALSTIVIASSTCIGCLTFALPAAYGLSRSRSVLVPIGLASLIILQMMPQTSTVIPLFEVLGAWHLLGGYPGLIFADIGLLLPFSVVVLIPAFRAIPKELDEAAAIDGASLTQRFLRVALPNARNGVATVGTMVFILASGEFLYSISFLSDPGGYPLSGAISQEIATYGIDWPGLMAVSVLASVPALVVFLAGHRALVRGLTLGAVK